MSNNTNLITKIETESTSLYKKTTPKSVTPAMNADILDDFATVLDNEGSDKLGYNESGLSTNSKVVVNAINELYDESFRKVDLGEDGFVREELVNPLQGEGKGIKVATNKPQATVGINFKDDDWSIYFQINGDKEGYNYVLSTSPIKSSAIGVSLERTGKAYRVRYAMAGYSSNALISKNGFIVITKQSNTYNFFYNGRLISTNEYIVGYSNLKTNTITIGGIQDAETFEGVTNSLRVFNYPLTATEVTRLYNGGRSDLVRLGDEYITKSSTPQYDSYSFKSFVSEDITTKISNKKFKLTVKNITTASAIHITSEIFKNLNLSKEVVEIKNVKIKASDNFAKSLGYNYFMSSSGNIPMNKNIVLDANNEAIVNFEFNKFGANNITSNYGIMFGTSSKTHAIDSWFEIDFTDSVFIARKCTSEYLPSSLTTTTWFDTAGNNHIQLTNATLDYSPLRKEVIVSNVAPSVVPDAIGQKYINQTSKIAYEAVGTSSISDWKIITT